MNFIVKSARFFTISFIPLFLLLACATTGKMNHFQSSKLSKEVTDAIALCSAGYASSDAGVLGARLIGAGADIRGELNKIESGTLDLTNIEMYKQYLICVENFIKNYQPNTNQINLATRHKTKNPNKLSGLLQNNGSQANSTSWNGLIFELKEAIMEGEKLTIRFRITSPGKDRSFGMVNGGNAFAMIDGEQYGHTHMQIGRSTGYDLYSGVTIPGDISVNSFVTFNPVPSDIERVDMLRLLFWNEKVSLRNIHLN